MGTLSRVFCSKCFMVGSMSGREGLETDMLDVLVVI